MTTDPTPPSPKRNPFDIYSLSAWRRRKPDAYSRYATFNRRMVAATIDSIGLMFLTPIFDAIAPINRSGIAKIGISPEHPAPITYLLMQMFGNQAFVESWIRNFMLQLVTFLAYSGVFWYFYGATPGKMLMRMKIVDARTEKPLNMLQIILRLCGYIVSGLCLMLGFLWIGTNRKRRAWHDFLADTVVINQPWPEKITLHSLNPFHRPIVVTKEPAPHETPAD